MSIETAIDSLNISIKRGKETLIKAVTLIEKQNDIIRHLEEKIKILNKEIEILRKK